MPYLRHKVAKVIARAGFDPASYAGRALLNVLENYPRDELFQIDEDTLYHFAIDIMNLSERPRVRALARADEFDRFVSVLVFVPKDRYDTQARRRIGEFLAGDLSRAASPPPIRPIRKARSRAPITSSAATRARRRRSPRETLEKGIAAIVRTWSDALRDALDDDRRRRAGACARHPLCRTPSAPPIARPSAPSRRSPTSRILEQLSEARPRAVDLYRREGDDDTRVST